jgi:hypothetical protein
VPLDCRVATLLAMTRAYALSLAQIGK